MAQVPAPPVTNPYPVAYGQSVVSPAASSAASSPALVTAPGLRVPSLPAGQVAPVDPGNPRMVRTAEMAVNLPKGGFPAAFDRVTSIAAGHGGYVTSSTSASTPGNGAVHGQLVLRVPADRFDLARQAVAELGRVERQSVRDSEVSGQLVDHDARLRSLHAQEEALRSLVGKALTVGEVLQVQPTLFSVRQQIEQLQAQRASLEQAAALSMIAVSLSEPGARAPAVRQGVLSQRIGDAGRGAVSVVGAMVLVVGWASPVVALAIVVLAASRLTRTRRSRPVAR